MIRLAEPHFLLLLVLLLLAGGWLWRQARRASGHPILRPRLKYSSLALVQISEKAIGPTLRTRLLGLPLALVIAACILIIVAMARPQTTRERQRFTEGIDIMLVIDVSDSMRALDFTPNRLVKAKEVVKKFIQGRTDDQMGITIFGRDTFTLCPLTQDYAALETFVDRIDFDLVNGEGTAIGMGLANAVNKLRQSQAKSKVVILLTDGENNAGKIDPISAAKIAAEFKVRVYTIGVGSERGNVRIPQMGPFGMQIGLIAFQLDVKQLTQIAEMTGGRFFRATDDKSLEAIYGEIDQLERTKIEAAETHYYDEWAHYLILPALGLVLLGFILQNTWLRTFP